MNFWFACGQTRFQFAFCKLASHLSVDRVNVRMQGLVCSVSRVIFWFYCLASVLCALRLDENKGGSTQHTQFSKSLRLKLNIDVKFGQAELSRNKDFQAVRRKMA